MDDMYAQFESRPVQIGQMDMPPQSSIANNEFETLENKYRSANDAPSMPPLNEPSTLADKYASLAQQDVPYQPRYDQQQYSAEDQKRMDELLNQYHIDQAMKEMQE